MNTAVATVVRQEAFDDVELQVIEHEGEEWFTAEDIGKALGLADPRPGIQKIYRRNKEELEGLSGVARLATPGGRQRVRIFNLQAVQKLGFFAHTPRSKAFRHWASHMLAHGIHQMKAHIQELEGRHRQALVTIADLNRKQTLALPTPPETPCPVELYSEAHALRLEGIVFDLEGELGTARAIIESLRVQLKACRQIALPAPAPQIDPKDLVLVPAHYLRKFRDMVTGDKFPDANRLMIAILEAQHAWEMLVKQFDKLGFLTGKADISLHHDPECFISAKMKITKEAELN